MESKGDEAIPRRPKRSKRINPTHFPSISSQDSVLPMPNLPSELISEILLKLPVASLLQFRSVSKSWLSLISSPEFVKAHLLLSASNKNYSHHGVIMAMVATTSGSGFKDCSLRSLLYHPVTAAVDLDYPGKIPYDYSRFVGSVNGLICFGTRLVDGSYDLLIWNPSIRKYKKLPNLRLDRSHSSYVDKHVDSDFGFAYDQLQDDYKVVGVFPIYRREDYSHAEVKIYSLRRDSWRRIDDLKGRELCNDSVKFVNGKLHWLDQQGNVISIDLTDKTWAEVGQPCYFEGCKEEATFKLGVLESDLSVTCCTNMWTHADVWVMKEYGIKESWTKMFTIKSPNYPIGHAFYPIILMSNEGELLLKYGSCIVKYNTKDDSIRYLDVTNFGACFEAEIYVKSLICPFSHMGP